MSVALWHPAIQLSLNRGLSKSIHSRELVVEFYDDFRKGFAKTIGQAIADDVYDNIIKPHVNNIVTGLYNLMRKIGVCHPIIFCVVMTLGIGVLVGFIIKKTFENSGGSM